jgi:hypothetical protein
VAHWMAHWMANWMAWMAHWPADWMVDCNTYADFYAPTPSIVLELRPPPGAHPAGHRVLR